MRIRGFLLLVFALTTGTVAADTVSVPVPDCLPASRASSDGQCLCAAGYSLASSPGDPALPFKTLFLLLPPDVDPGSVSARLVGGRQIISSAADIAPAPPVAAAVDGKVIHRWGKDKKIESGRNTLVYGRSAFYPSTNVELCSVSSLRKWQIATLRYYPFRYNPARKTLQQTSGGRITLQYRTRSMPHTAASGILLADPTFADRVKALALNFEEAQKWYAQPAPSVSIKRALSDAAPGYLILTTSAISASSTRLQTFVAHKQLRGFAVSVSTESAWGGGTGDAAAANIRAYLQSVYVAQNVKYVLLIGNPDPISGQIPMKMLWPNFADPGYREAPSDYFYADLTGNWDLNGDGYFGQDELDFGPGGVDLLPEVIVGRIPFYGDVAALDSILQKTIDYENGVRRGGWIRNVMLSMNPSDESTPGYPLGEQIRTDAVVPAAMTPVRAYDSEYGLVPAPEYTPCTYDNVLSAWQQRAGFHFYWTHGDETTAMDVFKASNCQYLDDAYPSFVFQCACLNARPEDAGNLAYAMLKRGALTTDGATRVSWYRPGQDAFADDDSNSGMAYDYALKLIRDHLPCGDAHFAMLTEVPNSIWMNHCVFNVYGDPSVSYPTAPLIAHSPLGKTDNNTLPYSVAADITSTAPFAAGSPTLRWSTNGGSAFTDVQMVHAGGNSYSASIPPQAYGTTVHYYLEARDITNLASVLPSDAPQTLFSFEVAQDLQAPVIVHEPLSDTPNKFGPYPVQATVTDDTAVQSVSVYYSINGGGYTHLDMLPQGNDSYRASIPGPTASGDIVSYYITATDTSRNANTAQLPDEPGCFSFRIGKRIYVAVNNDSTRPSYFVGGNVNAWQSVSDILTADPDERFQVSVLTSLKADPGPGLAGQDVLVLPDNGVRLDCLEDVSNWFIPGRVIVALDSAVCYACYTGWMWPGSQGLGGFATYWDYSATAGDQEIWTADPITAGYYVGQITASVMGDSQYYVNSLPADAHVLSVKNSNHDRAYAIYRDVPGKGRLVLLGPVIPPPADLYSMIRDACIAPAEPRQINVTSPNGGEDYRAGDNVAVAFSTSGSWAPGDAVTLEYCTGLDSVWHVIPGAESLDYAAGAFSWNTSGLPGSHGYLLRVSWAGNPLSDTSDATFSIIPSVDIAAAKSVPDGALIKISAKVVTCSAAGHTYVEEPNRRSGIRVASAVLAQSDLVDITGTVDTVNGERILTAETARSLGAAVEIEPFTMLTSALGGGALGHQPALKEYELSGGVRTLRNAAGANNVGLLVRLSGGVTHLGDGFFYLDDGSGCDDGSNFTGVRVICPAGVALDPGDHVVIDAVSSTWFDGANTFRAAVLPDAESIEPM